MMDVLKLRSEELSGENGRLRLQVAAAGQQHPWSMQHSLTGRDADTASEQQQSHSKLISQLFAPLPQAASMSDR